MYFFFASIIHLVNTPSPEQAAFNYFASEVVAKQYPQVKHLYLTGQSEAEASITGLFWKCFSDTDFRTFWSGYHATVATAVPIAYRDFPNFKYSAVSKRNRLQVQIYRTVAGRDGYYTYIKVYEMYYFVDHYLIKLSGKNLEIAEVCRTNEII